jgi:hypothetical protein
MPVQKGKRRKKTRRRSRFGDYEESTETDDERPASRSTSTPAPRRRWESPLWLNVAIGVAMVALGLWFLVSPQKGFGTGARTIILFGYFALAALYLTKAYRQYRSKQGY